MQRLRALSASVVLAVTIGACSGDDDTDAATTADGDRSASVTIDMPADATMSTTTTGPPSTTSTTTAVTIDGDDPTAPEDTAPPEDPVAGLVALWRTYPLHGANGLCTLYPYMDVGQVHAWLASDAAGSRDVTLDIEPAEIAPLARAVTTEEFDNSLRQVCA